MGWNYSVNLDQYNQCINLSGSQYESAELACSRLQISSQTLYAYVSRGLVKTKLHPDDSRKRLYQSDDVNRLAVRQHRGRSRKAVAHSTIDFGEPILRSTISSIHEGQFFYSGKNAVELSKTQNLEEIFELLCRVSLDYSQPLSSTFLVSKQRSPFPRFVEALAHSVTAGSPYGNKHHAYRLLRLMACNAAQRENADINEPIHELLARAWSVDKRAPDLIRRALVLCADHELNASTYATRVTASAGANLDSCLLTGISTLSGHHHGGLTSRCLKWMRLNSQHTPIDLASFSEQHSPPGFGHKLYPSGDPRAIELLAQCSAPKPWRRLVALVIKQTGLYPTLDLGLATLEEQLKLPKGAGFSIFAVGRTVGWLAHCFEQRRNGRLIRPRASMR